MSLENIEDIYSLSPMQEGLLFESISVPDSGAYVERCIFDIRGELNVQAFEKAWQKVVDRHPILRTAFVWEEMDEPVQAVFKNVKLTLVRHDWGELSRDEQKKRFEHYLKSDLGRDFDLSRPPLIRLALIRLSQDTYRFIFVFHHVLIDGWSYSLILKDVFAFYEAFHKGEDLHLEPPRPYRDYIGWLKKQDLGAAESFWRRTLKDFRTPTRLGIDRGPSPAIKNYADEEIRLSEEVTKELESFARRNQLTVNTVVQGAWALLLSRYSGAEDVLFGAVVAGRPAHMDQIESMVGLFINTLPVRAKIVPGESVLSWLKKMQDQQAETNLYEYSPLMKIQSWSEVPKGVRLFETLFVYENYPTRSLSASDRTFEINYTGYVEGTNYPLSIMAVPGTRLRLLVTYDSDRFEATPIRRMLGHFETLIKGILASPGKKVSHVPLLTEKESRQILLEWNQTEAAYPQNVCLHQLFQEQVKKTPKSVAVVFEKEELSYEELNRKSNQLAHYLKSLGVGSEVLVGICVERSLEMVVGILGILKAGGAYVPLDPEYPKDHLAFMLKDSGLKVLLTQERLREQIPAHEVKAVMLDAGWKEISKESEQEPDSKAKPDDLLYVIYTSGSTGNPKGVQVIHQSVINTLFAERRQVEFTSRDRLLAVTSLSFDPSVLEIFLPLMTGGRLVIAASTVIPNGALLLKELEKSGATVLNGAPVLWRSLLEAGWQGKKDLKMLCGGEVLSEDLAEKLLDRGAALWNCYGPTETSIDAVIRKVEGRDNAASIGRPIANIQAYILDSHLQPVPIGIPGELYIGGTGLARGYLNRPELSAEKFISNPFRDEPGGRLYKTGDLARYLPDGSIDYLGRVDDQIKIRGYRIEPGEIESILTQHPDIKEAVVIAREDEPGNKRLVAYVVSRERQNASSYIRSYLSERLPAYMIPSAFVMIESLPVTPNGKIDRKALPAPEGRPDLEKAFVAPRTEMEKILAGIWSEVLKIVQVGIHDNFFELGGHSLKVTQVVSRVRATLQVDITVHSLFEAPTIEEFAKMIEEALGISAKLGKTPIAPISRESCRRKLEPTEEEVFVFPASYAQQRLWFVDQLMPGNPMNNIPGAMRLKGSLNAEALGKSLNEIVRRHEALRTSFGMEEEVPVQRIHLSLTLDLPVVDLRSLPSGQRESEVSRLYVQEANRPFDLAKLPLLRPTLLRLGEEEHVLFLTMHHIISDGWSHGVFARELGLLYEAFLEGKPSPLPDLAIQYVDFAQWQKERLPGRALDEQMSYWKERLKGKLPVLDLSADRPRPAIQTSHGAVQSFKLPKDLLESLKALSREKNATLFMTLLATFKTLLYRYTGQEDVIVGSPIANRDRKEIEDLIGFFVNTLVLRTDLSGNLTFRDLLGRVKEMALGAYAHQDTPFEQLVEAINPKRDMSHSPMFQVMFILQNAPMSPMNLAGVTLSPVDLQWNTAKFDLTLGMAEGEEGLEGWVEYNTDLFDQARIERMVGHFETLLKGIVANPNEKLSNLPLLTEEERRQLLVEWNKTEAPYPKDRCVHELFEEQAKKTPKAVAVVFEGQELSYEELNCGANQLAHYLQSLGVGPETLVGICVERSLEMVMGILGILKAGGAYVPMDPEYPKERLAFMLKDSGIKVLLTQEKLIGQIPEHEARVVRLDADWKEIAKKSEKNLRSGVQPDNLAYVIYTSGSTGQPKGVQAMHKAVVHILYAEQKQVKFKSQDILLAVISLSFEPAAMEIFMTLMSGGKLVIAGSEVIKDGAELLKELDASKATILHGAPALWRSLLESGWQGKRPLKMLCGGEPLTLDLAKKLLERGDSLWNCYGPTETTILSTICKVEKNENLITVGRPVSNTQIYILDKNLKPVPIGVAGELHIGGIGLAKGYLNRPELTAVKFISDPFSDEPGAQLYKTGDLARYLPDGNIECLGRIDNQVKIRGFRIELGEIESVLTQQPGIKEAVVVAREDEPGSKRLVAYLVTNRESRASLSELRNALKKRVPDYMIPSAFVMTESLPLTPNGKIDRKALPAPAGSRPDLEKSFVAPRTEAEKVLAGIWSEVLQLHQVGIHDNFFDLGGHSLKATQVISRVRTALQADVAVHSLFESPTIEEFCKTIEEAKNINGKLRGMAIVPFSRENRVLQEFEEDKL